MFGLGKRKQAASDTQALDMTDLLGQIAAINKSQAVIEFDLVGTILKANDNFLNTLGYTLAEVQGQHHRMFVEPGYRESAEYKQFWEKLGRGEYDTGEYKRLGKGGKEVWIQASYNPVLDAAGKPYKVVKYAADVTAQKLRNADFEGQLAAIGKSQAVIEFDLTGKILTANDNFLKTLGYTLADGVEYIRAGQAVGLDVDKFAPRLSFFWAIGMNFHMEVAKLRAARLLWARLVQQFEPKNPKSQSLRTHSQTSGWSLTAQDVFNNVVRTCVEAMAATQGHTQSLHTNALDEAIALPTDFSARIARNTQLVLQQESGTCRVIDPWAGSAYVEKLTHDLAQRAWEHITEVEEAGGMAKAIEAGIPKMRIEEAAARTQARIDSGQQPVIGVNTYVVDEDEPIEVLKVDNARVRAEQIAKLQRLRAERDDAEVTAALQAITAGASAEGGRDMSSNLLALCIDAARAKATVGEMSAAMEEVFGRYTAQIRTISGVYRDEAGQDSAVTEARRVVEEFEEAEGRRPRILVAKMGQDGHDRGQKVIATAFADLGFDVDVGPLFQTPAEVARQAVEADVHVVGVSSLAAGHLTLVPALRRELDALGREDLMIVVGGVIPEQDFDELRANGADDIYPPGTVISQAAVRLVQALSARAASA